MGIAKLTLADLQQDVEKEIDLRLMPSLDMLKIKDKKDRGNIIVKVSNNMCTQPKIIEPNK